MNKERRKRIDQTIDQIRKLPNIEDLVAELENIRDEEQEYYDNMPESLKSSERGERASEAINTLDDAIDKLRDLDFEEIASELETIE